MKRRNANNEADNYRAAFVVSSIYNVNRDTKRHPEPFRPEDFIGGKKAKQSPESMMAAARGIAVAFGGKIPEG